MLEGCYIRACSLGHDFHAHNPRTQGVPPLLLVCIVALNHTPDLANWCGDLPFPHKSACVVGMEISLLSFCRTEFLWCQVTVAWSIALSMPGMHELDTRRSMDLLSDLRLHDT